MSSVSALGAGDTLAAIRNRVFQKTDTDGSGSLSLDEVSKVAQAKGPYDGAYAEQAFNAMDSNGDGQVSQSEFSSFTPVRHAVGGHLKAETGKALLDILAQADTDNNGTLNLDEFTALGSTVGASAEKSAEVFAKVDSNSNGEVTIGEIASALDAIHQTPPITNPGNTASSATDTTSTTATTASNDGDADSDAGGPDVDGQALASLIKQYLANYLSGTSATAQSDLGQLFA